MKNHFIILMLLLTFLTSEALSQDKKLRIGFIGGVSVNELTYNFDDKSNYLDTSFTNTPKVRFSIGTYLTYNFVNSFSMKFLAHFTIKGGVTDATMTYNTSIGYIQLSLLPQYNLPLKGDYDNLFYVNAGGYFALRTGANQEESFGNYHSTRKLGHNLKGNDAGLVFGIGIIGGKFNLDIFYSHGLTNILNDAGNAGFVSIKNRSLNISIGFTGGL